MPRRPGTCVVHPVISTPNLAAAMAYYRTVLELVEEPTSQHDRARLTRLSGIAEPSARAVILRAQAGGEIELVQFEHPSGNPEHQHFWPDAGIQSITFQVADLQETMTRVAVAGYGPVGEVVRFASAEGELDVVYVTAPDGLVLTLTQQVGHDGSCLGEVR